MNTIKLRWEVTKATEHDYWAINNILRIYIRYDVQAGKMFWETCPINGGIRAKNGLCDTMPEAIAAAENAALQMLMEDLEPCPPAEIVLEWLPDADGEVVAFNGYLNAATWHFPEHTKARIYLRNIVLMELDFRGDDRKQKATEWCEQMLKAITTQSPRP